MTPPSGKALPGGRIEQAEETSSPTPGEAPAGQWHRLLELLRPHAAVLTKALLCALVMMLLGVSTSYFVKYLVDSVLVRSEGRLLDAMGAGMLLIVLFRALFGALREHLIAHVGRDVSLGLIGGFESHVLRLPLRFFEGKRVGEIISRVGDAAKVREVISGTTTTAAFDGLLVIFMLVILWLSDARLAMVVTAFIPFLFASVVAHHSATRRCSREAMENSARFSAHLVEDVSGMETVKAFGVEQVRAEEGEGRLLALVRSMLSLQKIGISINAIGTFLTGTAGIVVLWYGGRRVMRGTLTIGELMFFYTMLAHLLEPLVRLAAVNLRLQDALAAVERLYQVMDLRQEPLDGGEEATLAGVREGIELHGVGFRYGSGGDVLERTSLRIPAGKTVAIVGESGSGKSTLLKLLMRFHEPTDGRITIDRVDLRGVALASLRSRIGYISQDPFIFNGTIAENVALGRPGATQDEIREAVHAAGLGGFIEALPLRYETITSERASNLSGGQRQRLAIARALVRRPEILLFDEATSHLDSATERAIQESLRSALSGKTVVVVAHRLSTVKEADLIYVLNRGRVVEQGTHRQLMARREWYWALWRAQTDDGERPSTRPMAIASQVERTRVGGASPA